MAKLPMGTVNGRGTAAGAGAVAGNFTGPRAGDRGQWTAEAAATVLNYGVTGTINKGPDAGKTQLIGDLYGYATAGGTMFGIYYDNSNVGPGVVVKVYPVHGTFMNSMLTANIAFGPTKTYALVGQTGLFYGLPRVSGSMLGPKSRDSGTWAGLAQ